MKRHTAHLAVLLITLFSFLSASAQDLHGTIIDSLSRQPLPQASIWLQIGSNTRLMATSDNKGNFHFKNTTNSAYTLIVEYVGYKTWQQTVKTNQPVNIQLVLDSKDLKAVTVSATKPYIVQRIDKTIVNISCSPIAAGGNAWDVLVRAPGMLAQESNLQLKGKKVVVLIDGRYTNLSGDDLKNMLTAMPANGIERIELIPNPSAKYEAQGGSVVNIVMTKNSKLGTNGTATIGGGAGRYGLFNAGVSLNYRDKKMNTYGGYDYQHNEQYSDLFSDRTVSSQQHILENRHDIEQRNSHSFRAGLDYDINKRNTVGVLVKGLLTYRNRNAVTHSLVDYNNTSLDSASTVDAFGNTRLFTPAVNLYYKTILDSTGKELRINGDYFAYDKHLEDNFATRYFDPKGAQYTNPFLLKATAPAFNDVKSFAADYSQPLKKGSLEAGVKASLASTDNDAIWQQGNNGIWKEDPTRTNHFIYHENVYSAYLTLNKTYNKWGVMAGLRGEQTFTEGRSITLDQTNKNQYLNLFPHLAVQYSLSDQHQFSFTYRKSIERYKYDVVNPFIVYKSQYAWSQGNPYLAPTIGHNIALNYSYNNELFTTVSYGRFTSVSSNIFKKDTASNAVISTWDNLSSADDLELSVSHSKSFFNNKLITNNMIMFFYARYNAPASTGLDNAMLATMFNTDNIIMLPKSFKLQVSGTWFSPYALGVFKSKSMWSMNAGLSKTMLKNQGTLALNVSDIFNTSVNRYDIASFGVTSYNRAKSETRFIKLNFTYRFGNKNVKASNTRRSSVESENRRMQ